MQVVFSALSQFHLAKSINKHIPSIIKQLARIGELKCSQICAEFVVIRFFGVG